MSRAYAVKQDLPKHIRGDKWLGIFRIGPIRIDNAQPDVQLARVAMHFRKGPRVYKLDSDASSLPDSPIIIEDADTWQAKIPAVFDFLPLAGMWDWDMEFWFTGDDAPITFYYGTLEVYDDVTKTIPVV